MKKMTIYLQVLFMLLFATGTSYAQLANSKLYDLFPVFDKNMNDSDIRALLKKEELPREQSLLLLANGLSGEAFVPIGKIISPKGICLLVADIGTENSDDRLIRVHSIAFDTKKGTLVLGSLQHYMTVSGNDLDHHEAKIEKIGNSEYRFTHFERKTRNPDEQKTTIAVYKLGKKYLEFSKYIE